MFPIKQGDLFPELQTTVRDESGVAVDLAGATVTFSMRKARSPSTIKVDGAAGVTYSGVDGLIAYLWQAGDTDEPGTYEGEFHVTPQAGSLFRVPTVGYITVVVEQSVGA